MNLLSYFTPKSEVHVLSTSWSVRQVIESMEQHGYVALPLIDEENRYVGTVTPGDILSFCRSSGFQNTKDAEKNRITDVPRRHHPLSVSVGTDMRILYAALLDDNFVPVEDDRGVFIGIVTRRRFMEAYREQIMHPEKVYPRVILED